MFIIARWERGARKRLWRLYLSLDGGVGDASDFEKRHALDSIEI
jgi:hypothetical protein